jgi:DUF4097 and DUF4098 domain-containing protein YvlB
MSSQFTRHITLMSLLLGLAVGPLLTGCNGHTTVRIDGNTVEITGRQGGNEAQETVQQRVAADQVNKLDVDTSAGNIEVRAGDEGANVIIIKAAKHITGRQTVAELKRYLPRVKVTQRLEGDTLIVRSEAQENELPSGVGYYVSYVVSVPKRLAVTLKTVSGDISVQQVRGGVQAGSSSGGIQIKDVAGSVELQTVSGDITGEDLPDATGIKVNTSSGAVHLNNIAGRFEAHSVSGDIHVEGARIADSLQAESSSGALNFSAVRAANSELALNLTSVSGDIAYNGDLTAIDAHSSSGNIEIAAANDSAPHEVKAENISGNLKLDLPALTSARITAHTVSGTLNLPEQGSGSTDDNSGEDRHTATITLGNGETPVTLNTSSGDIELDVHH